MRRATWLLVARLGAADAGCAVIRSLLLDLHGSNDRDQSIAKHGVSPEVVGKQRGPDQANGAPYFLTRRTTAHRITAHAIYDSARAKLR
jgi:hypothetical protein